ncbi:MAG: VOC family protein, partial [Rhodospirillales bacterium]|nr:VOC family protein [Rhodospirillales bacterium]
MPKPFDQFVTFIYCDDLEESCAFYGDVLGLELVLDQGPCRIFRAGGDGFLGVCTKAEAPAERGNVIITLVTDDVDGWYEDLKAKG